MCINAIVAVQFCEFFCFFQSLILYIDFAIFAVWIYLKYFLAFYEKGRRRYFMHNFFLF